MIHYSKVQLPDNYSILGVELKPFSIGHFILLDRVDCALVSGNPDATMSFEDFLLAVAICHRTYEENLKAFEDNSFFKWIKEWGEAVHKEFKNYSLEDKGEAILYRMNLFKKYMREGNEMPKYWNESTDESKPSGGHWTQAVLLILQGELGYTPSEALNMPLSKAFSDYLKFLETKGVVRLFTEEELQRVKELEKAKNA